jgi:pyruvate carboxylase subunit B
MRDAAGEGVDLQILTRSVSGVTLTTQALPALELQARLMRKHGTTIDRNFDFMNDVDNLVATAQADRRGGHAPPAVRGDDGSPLRLGRDAHARVLRRRGRARAGARACGRLGVHEGRLGHHRPAHLLRDGARPQAILPDDVPLWQHTHDTASMAVACYMAGIEGGVDGIDLSVRPLASGTSQPDVRSMWHALKGTGYTLDVDHTKMNDIEVAL